jgi:ankyrin repeat protein
MILNRNWSLFNHLIAEGGHAEVVKALLAFNSEPRWKNKNGVNALAGTSTSSSSTGCFSFPSDFHTVTSYCAPAAAISAHKEEGGRLPVIKELLSYSFKRDLGIVESRSASTGWTPLIRASYKGFSDVARMLLDYNADIHAQGKKGFTALIAASQVLS